MNPAAGNVIPLPARLPIPSPERFAVIFALADEAWPEYERSLAARRLPPALRVVG
jgi:hypothetical protein